MHDRPVEEHTLGKRLALLTASLTVGAVVWFMLGESESITAAEADGGKVLARVNGKAITAEEVEETIASQLIKLQRDRHALIAKAVETQVQNTLLAAAAEEKGLSQEEFLDQEVNNKLADVDQAKVDAFYQARQQQIRAPKAQVEDQIRKLLLYEELMASLEAAAEVEVLTEPFRVEVAADGPKKGPDSAPVTIVEFSDFECPFCGRVNPALAKVHETYGDKVQIVFRQFPLDIHRNARKAGEASLCADEQGLFWEMHDAMFGDQKNLTVDGLKSIAGGIADLESQTFNECLDSGRHAATVEKDLAEGSKAGVASTPTFFINGRHLSGAQPYESFAQIIDEELGS
ncbi:MAG: thioredoxin domain-containing protein [Acidobacteriota bacterium]